MKILTNLQFWKKDTAGPQNLTVPEEWLEADIKQGITNQQVEERRKKFGWNEIVTEKENLFLKFLGFFTGPVLYGKSYSQLIGIFATAMASSSSRCVAQIGLSSYGRIKFAPHHGASCNELTSWHSHGTCCPARRWSS